MRYQEGTFHEMTAKNVYASPVILGIGGLLASAIPNWSSRIGMIFSIILLLFVIWLTIGRIFKLHLIVRWHAISMVLAFNLFSMSFLIPFGRVFSDQLWVLILLVGSYALCYVASFRYRYLIAREIYFSKKPKTRFRKIYGYFAFGYILVAGIVVGGKYYKGSMILERILGTDNLHVFFAIVLMPFAFILLIPFQGLWTRVINPGYDFNEDDHVGDT